MPASPFASLRAAFCAGLFLAGALGVPLADAATFHMAGQDPCAGVTHLEAQGNTHHADRCALAQPTAAQREALGSAEAVRALPPAIDLALVPANTAPSSTALLTLQHSRAPPA